jgi:hypothetical protein
MRTPLRPFPEDVNRWVRRAGRLRWLDALAAWLIVWGVFVGLRPATDWTALGILALLVVGPASAVPPLRRRWRPVSAAVAVALGWRLRPGDRAWQVWPDGARPVLVTSTRWRHVVVAGLVRDSGEGSALPRTRVLLVPASRVARI